MKPAAALERPQARARAWRMAVPLLTGLLATATMDAGSILATRTKLIRPGSEPIGPRFIGRWVGYMTTGRFRHRDILEAPALRGETWVGFATHYTIGMALSEVYFRVLRFTRKRPSVATGLLYGAATTILPMLIVWPAYGLGAFGHRAANPGRLIRMSAVGHVVFGAALSLWCAVLMSSQGGMDEWRRPQPPLQKL